MKVNSDHIILILSLFIILTSTGCKKKPTTDNCISTSSASNSSTPLGLSFGGYLNWKDQKGQDQDCSVLIHHLPDNQIKIFSSFRCVRDLSIANTLYSFSGQTDPYEINLDYNISKDSCSAQTSDNQQVSFIRVSLNSRYAQIDYLDAINSYHLALLNSNQALSGDDHDQTPKWLAAQSLASIEFFSTFSTQDDFHFGDDFNANFDNSVCVENHQIADKAAQYCSSSPEDDFCQFYLNDQISYGCFLYSDLVILDVKYLKPEVLSANGQVTECLNSTLANWAVDSDSQWHQAVKNYQNARIESEFSDQSSEALKSEYIQLNPFGEIEHTFNQGAANNTEDDHRIKFFIDKGLHLLSSFSFLSSPNDYIYSRIALSKSSLQPGQAFAMSSFIKALIKRDYGYVFVFNKDHLKINNKSNGSLLSYNYDILAGLYSAKNAELSGGVPRSIMVANDPVQSSYQPVLELEFVSGQQTTQTITENPPWAVVTDPDSSLTQSQERERAEAEQQENDQDKEFDPC